MPSRIRRARALPALLLVTAVSLGLPAGPASPAAAAQPGCRVSYVVSSEFNTGFLAIITIANDGPATNGWRLDFTFPSDSQRLTSAFSARWTQHGAAVTALSTPWNARLATGTSVQIGFVGAKVGANPLPTDLRITGCGDTPLPPTSLLTGPSDGLTMVEGQVSQLVADTLGFPGTVTRVDFRVDGTLLGTDTTAPFVFLWFPLPAGTFTITATAYDDRGTVATSAPVQLIVHSST
ncbi:MAG: hypothetical protein V7637_3385 [Mycobacteriales bacterium]